MCHFCAVCKNGPQDSNGVQHFLTQFFFFRIFALSATWAQQVHFTSNLNTWFESNTFNEFP